MLWHLRGLHSIKPIHYIFSMKQSTIFAIAAALFASTSAVAQVSYPPAQKGTTVDEYFGEKVADPYRQVVCAPQQWIAEPICALSDGSS